MGALATPAQPTTGTAPAGTLGGAGDVAPEGLTAALQGAPQTKPAAYSTGSGADMRSYNIKVHPIDQ